LEGISPRFYQGGLYMNKKTIGQEQIEEEMQEEQDIGTQWISCREYDDYSDYYNYYLDYPYIDGRFQ